MKSLKFDENKRAKIILAMILALIAILYLIKIYLLSELTPSMPDYSTLLEKTKKLKRDNMRLNEQVLNNESLTHISEEASKSGMVRPTYIYLK